MDQTQQQSSQHQTAEEEPIDLRKYWAILLKRKWAVLLVFVLCVGVTAVFTLRQKKIYSSTCSLVIDAQMPQVLGSEVRDVVDVSAGTY
jgi:uncharacterized protein involved in exopolysaccharide biosynthesis